MAVLNSKFDILRGWPNGSAVAEDLVKVKPVDADVKAAIKDGVYRHGNFVAIGYGKAADEHVAYGACSVRSHNTASSSTNVRLGLIIEGDEETSSKLSGTVTCLVAGGYVVRLHLEGQVTQNAFGSTSIPDGRDQFVLTRPRGVGVQVDDVVLAAGTGGTGLAEDANSNTAFRTADNTTKTLEAGNDVTVINGVVCVAAGTEPVIGTCLKVDTFNQTCDILVH